MKYKLFRSPGDLDKAVRKHELVAVETGKSASQNIALFPDENAPERKIRKQMAQANLEI